MARILTISSHVAFGPVGNAAAVPALQARGHEVLAVPTIILANHAGIGKPVGFRTTPENLAAILDRIAALTSVDAVMTGYFAAPEQVAETARVIAGLRKANPALYVLVDPVIGDDSSLYVPEPVAAAIRDLLLPLATCLTPNRFELEWLTGWVAGTTADAISAARSLNIAEVVATSVPAGEGQLATLVVTAETHGEQIRARHPVVPSGTGDLLAGSYLAERLERPPVAALARAQQVLDRAIGLSSGTAILDVAGALHKGSTP
jgi:pyridoxine kinase